MSITTRAVHRKEHTIYQNARNQTETPILNLGEYQGKNNFPLSLDLRSYMCTFVSNIKIILIAVNMQVSREFIYYLSYTSLVH